VSRRGAMMTGMDLLRAVLLAVHVVTGVGWLGAMGYSLFLVQPKAARFFGTDDDRHEEFLITLAHGNRWRVVALLAALALSGVGLSALGHHGAGWWVGVGAQVVLFAVAGAAFWWVSWRAWPARVFAIPEERPAWRRRFRRAAWLMITAGGSATLVGVVLTAVRT
jgi:hypothetical protein